MHLCTYVSEEGGGRGGFGFRRVISVYIGEQGGGGREGTGSEAPSLLSYTLRYVSLTELGNV
jgi:hypothetical protein